MLFPQLLSIDTFRLIIASPVKVWERFALSCDGLLMGKRSNVSDEANCQTPSTNYILCRHWEKMDIHVVEVLIVAR